MLRSVWLCCMLFVLTCVCTYCKIKYSDVCVICIVEYDSVCVYVFEWRVLLNFCMYTAPQCVYACHIL